MELKLPNSQTLEELVTKYKANLLALQDDAVLRPRVARERAMELTQNLIKEFEKVKDGVVDIFSAKHSADILGKFEKLPEYLFMFYSASMEAEQPWTEEEKKQFQALAATVKDHDVRYLKFAQAIFHGNEAANVQLSQIAAGRGYRDDAEDVIALTNLLLTSSEVKLPNLFFTEQDLRKAEGEARKFLWLLNGQSDTEPSKGSPPDMWHRAYTLWQQAYEVVARAGRNLVENEKEAYQKFPRIHNKISRGQQTERPANTATPSRVENF